MKLAILAQKFEDLFTTRPEGVASAPGRVNLIGEFTDYNNGFVLPSALEFFNQIAFKTRNDDKVLVYSLQYPGQCDEFSLSEDIVQGDSQWGNYIRAVAFVLKARGKTLTGMDMLIESNVPQGAGLSSSAALEVAVAGAFNKACALGLTLEEIAVIGQQAENDFMHCQCGIMDQLISAKGQQGQALLIDCQDLSSESIQIPTDLTLVIVNSNYPRKLVDSEYNQRRLDCESAAKKMAAATLRDATMETLHQAKAILTENEYKRAHHVISENARVLEATQALKHNDMNALRQLMAASHSSLKHDFEVTVPATDGLVEICQKALGDRGAVRMTGGGFGGAIVCLCRSEDVAKIQSAVTEQYFERFNLQASIFVCKAGGGLQVSPLTDLVDA